MVRAFCSPPHFATFHRHPSYRFAKTSRSPVMSLAAALSHFKSTLPVLDSSTHKGQSGRICVVGGSPEYTGAPYFAATSTLRIGADLAYIVTSDVSAAAAIKASSPDIIVYPSLSFVFNVLPRAHSLVIGPGLGRSEKIARIIREVLTHEDALRIPIVIDADALFFVATDQSIRDAICQRRSNSPPIVLTPNVVELNRLCSATRTQNHQDLANFFGSGIIILSKGPSDRILSANVDAVIQVDTPASLKRVGGQGDILAGFTALSLAWSHRNALKAQIRHDSNPNSVADDKHWGVHATVAAAALTRECSRRAFAAHGRSLLTSDILSVVGSVIHDLEFGSLIDQLGHTD